jgi:NADH-quinone oxidoreductase subunit N
MFFSNWIENTQAGLVADLLAFAPELILCFAIILMLLLRLFTAMNRTHMATVALCLTVVALGVSAQPWVQPWLEDLSQSKWPSLETKVPDVGPTTMFTGLLAYDNFTTALRLFLFGFTALIIWLTQLTGIPDREDSADFYTLLLGAIVGMSLMASANHLLMVYIGVEMASLPSYALAGFLKGKRQSSEAALKYVVYGGGASGIMLYGISLLAGKFGTAFLPDLAKGYAALLTPASGQTAVGFDAILVLGTLLVLIGVAFKLSAVPFHFWCPDVFEGASAEVAAFLSVASKGAALALLARFLMVLSGLSDVRPAESVTWLTLAQSLAPAVAFIAALTATFGNLAAYLQTNLKRLLAYSTIAHAGYMLMGLAAFTREGASAVVFYLVTYLFMNLGAFAVVAFLRNQTGSEDLSSFRGLVRRSPVMVVTLGFFLFSLLGVPPLAGFAAKFQIFRVLFDAAKLYREKDAVNLSYTMYALVVIGGLNTVVSLVYYIKVLKVMTIDRSLDEVEGHEPKPLAVPFGSRLYAGLLSAVVLLLGILWDPLAEYSDKGVNCFRKVAHGSANAAAADNPQERQRIGMRQEPAVPRGGAEKKGP